ncbi:hypothetical protein M501DRAFT_1012719 [Patellaria atrata CBS 101060]|uniref:Uncharacterized protein n=1 Tax=Patellaria atrata CBS 101060 TaxID=1346257 RepID=A0A9P4SJD7_9PEZI|nr:hypothetical protein M501DRAFT_1012719 [Patellaria atrata CBS 101060]
MARRYNWPKGNGDDLAAALRKKWRYSAYDSSDDESNEGSDGVPEASTIHINAEGAQGTTSNDSDEKNTGDDTSCDNEANTGDTTKDIKANTSDKIVNKSKTAGEANHPKVDKTPGKDKTHIDSRPAPLMQSLKSPTDTYPLMLEMVIATSISEFLLNFFSTVLPSFLVWYQRTWIITKAAGK